MISRRAVPKWPIVNFAGIDWTTLLIGIGAGVGIIILIEEIFNKRFKGIILSPTKRRGGRGR